MRRNNLIRAEEDTKEHYKMYKVGRRWVFAGMTIITFGSALLMGQVTANASDEQSTESTDATTATSTQSSNSQNKQVTLSNSSSSTSESGDSSESESEVSASPTSQTNSSSEPTSKKADLETNQGTTGTDTVATNNGSSIDSKTKSNNENESNESNESSEVTPNKEKTTTPKLDATIKKSQLRKSTRMGLSDATIAKLNESVNDSLVDSTNVTRAATNSGITMAAADSSFTLSSDKIGYGSDGNGIKVTFTFSGNKGDIYEILIPADTAAYSLQSVPVMPSTMGTTTTTKNADGSMLITNTLLTSASYSQVLKLNQINNYQGQAAPMDEIGTTIKTITTTKNGVIQSEASFTQTITPNADISDPVRTNPSSTAINNLLPSTDYVYEVDMNEADGVLNNDYTSNRVNSAANYGGTTVTIPVPASFKLNVDLTSSLNSLTSGDGTTITQPDGEGGDIIITVAPGKGSQNFNGLPAYKIAGSYDLEQTDQPQTLTANGNVKMTQVINANGDVLTAESKNPWTETILSVGNDDGTPTDSTAKLVAYGNSSVADTKLLLDTDESNNPDYLNSFGFTTSTAAGIRDAQITINIPDGLDATSFKVPDGGASTVAYLEGTTSYGYSVVLADGTTETGIVQAGGTVTPKSNSAIRTIVLTPNYLAPGATTGTTTSQRIIVYGKLSDEYDNGNPV